MIQDIGVQSGRFLELFKDGAGAEARALFFAGLDPCQDRLSRAFHSYLQAFDTSDPAAKRIAMIEGNREIVYHEHIRLEP